GEIRSARPTGVDRGEDRGGDARRHGASCRLENPAPRLPGVLHGMGGKRPGAVRGRCLRVRPPAGRTLKWFGSVWILCGMCAVVSTGAANHPPEFDTDAVDFAISFNGERAAYRDLSTSVLPGATLSLEAADGPPGDYDATASAGMLIRRGTRAWEWRAPKVAGLSEIKIDGPAAKDTITL